ncbi:hypothetical protein BDR26DRAFT_918129 [Obelidium mucronatum]|nr:hypothetical protein BDR26DRAFT_918129 [Obelidium mucronatum]
MDNTREDIITQEEGSLAKGGSKRVSTETFITDVVLNENGQLVGPGDSATVEASLGDDNQDDGSKSKEVRIRIPLKDTSSEALSTTHHRSNSSTKRHASVVQLAPPGPVKTERKRKPPAVLKAVSTSGPNKKPTTQYTHQQHQHHHHHHQQQQHLPSATFHFEASNLKLAGFNGVPSNMMPPRPHTRHISPVDMFNLKRENLMGKTTAMQLNANYSRAALVTAGGKLSGGIHGHSRFDAEYERGWAAVASRGTPTLKEPLQFLEIHIPAVADESTLTLASHLPTIERAIPSPTPPNGPPPTAAEKTRPEDRDTLLLAQANMPELHIKYPQSLKTYDMSELDKTALKYGYMVHHKSPNHSALEAHLEKRRLQTACDALGVVPNEQVKALIEELSNAATREHKLPGIPATAPAYGGGGIIRKNESRGIQEGKNSGGTLYLSTHGDRSWRFTALPSIMN